jgi:hypothetical protein
MVDGMMGYKTQKMATEQQKTKQTKNFHHRFHRK